MSKKPVPPAKRSKGKKSPSRRRADGASGLGPFDDDLLFVFSHPLRIRMLAFMHDAGEASPSDLARALGVGTYHTSYHMRVLVEYGCAEPVRTEQVGSLNKTIYRPIQKLEFPKEVWEQLPPALQHHMITYLFQASFADAEVALQDRVYEQFPESHASWANKNLDKQGWEELVELFDATLESAMAIVGNSESRHKEEGPQADASDLRVSFCLVAFPFPRDQEPPETDFLRHGPT